MSISIMAKRAGPSTAVISLLIGLALAVLFAGAFVAIFPWWLTLALVIIPGIVLLAFAFPYQGLLLTMLLVFNAIPYRRLFPKLPVGGGGLEIYDLLILLLLVSVLFRCVIRKTSIKAQLGSLFVPLAYVVACVVISIVYVKMFSPNPFVLTEARQYIGYMLLPIAAISIDTPSKYRWFINTLLGVGVIVAGIMLFQSFTDINVIGGRVEELDRFNPDVTRSTVGGTIYIMTFSIYFLLGAATGRRLSWWICAPLVMVLLGGLLVTFGRGVWFGGVVGLVVATYLYRGAAAAVLVPLAAALLTGAAIGIMSMSNERIGVAIVDRALGISREFESGNSYYYRRTEAIEALRSIARKPFMGVGLGGDYKVTVTTNNTFQDEKRYIHNSYLLLPLKMGLHAGLIPVLFIFAAAGLVRRAISVSSRRFRHIVAAASGAFVVPVITSVTQPEWGTLAGIAAICSLLLVLLLYLRFGAQLEPSAQTATKPLKRNYVA